MTQVRKIVLSGSRDIPFNLLVLSQANVRRVKAGVSIDALAADIARRGLLQSLTARAQTQALTKSDFDPIQSDRIKVEELIPTDRRMLTRSEPDLPA